MTPSPPGRPGPSVLHSTEVDAVAAVVRACAGVSALDGGPFTEVASYLPGRIVPGVVVDDTRIRVQVRSGWGIPADDLAALITAALTPIAGPRPVDVAIADIDDPPVDQPAGVTEVPPWSRPGVTAGLAPSRTQPGGER